MSDDEDPEYCPSDPDAPDTAAAADEAIVVNLPDSTGRDTTSKAPRRSSSARSSLRARPEADVAALQDRVAVLEEEKTKLEAEKEKADELRELYNSLLKASEEMRDAFSHLSCPLLRAIPIDPVVMHNHGEQVFSANMLHGCLDGRNPVNRQPLGTPHPASFVKSLAYEAAAFAEVVDKQSKKQSLDWFGEIRAHKRYISFKEKFDRSFRALSLQEYDEFHDLALEYGNPALVEQIERNIQVIPTIRELVGRSGYVEDAIELARCYKVVGEKEEALRLLYTHAKSEPQAFKALYSDTDISVAERTTLLVSYSGPHTWFYCKAMMTFIARDIQPGSVITPTDKYAKDAALAWGEKLTDDIPHDTDHNMDQEAFDLLRRLKGEPAQVIEVPDGTPPHSELSPSYAPEPDSPPANPAYYDSYE